MEHGAAWVTYRPDLAASEVDELRAAMPSSYAILSPFPDLPSPVVASAWGRQLMLDGADDPDLRRFFGSTCKGLKRLSPERPVAAARTAASRSTCPAGWCSGDRRGPCRPAAPPGGERMS